MVKRFFLKFCLAATLGLGLPGCSQNVPAHLKPLSAETRALLAMKGMREETPIYLRIFKQESILEVWKAKDDGHYQHLKSYRICSWSGQLGPKLKQGDKQAPEGFYRVARGQMNPQSRYHLSFNLGFPNAYDRAHGRSGAHLMVHGNCKSAGCYAMTDAQVEEIYILAREAFVGGQETFPVHVFPFHMTNANMERYQDHRWAQFWRTLKEGYDFFEVSRLPPKVDICEKRYLLNASFVDQSARPEATKACPAYEKIIPDIYLGELRLEYANKQGTTVSAQEPSPSLSASPLSLGYGNFVGSVKQNGVRNSIRLGQ